MSYIPVTKEELSKRLKENNKVFVVRIRDMVSFRVTGIGENVFIIKDRHGLEHVRLFSGPWLLEKKDV